MSEKDQQGKNSGFFRRMFGGENKETGDSETEEQQKDETGQRSDGAEGKVEKIIPVEEEKPLGEVAKNKETLSVPEPEATPEPEKK